MEYTPVDEFGQLTECPSCGRAGRGITSDSFAEEYGYDYTSDGYPCLDIRTAPCDENDMEWCPVDDSPFIYVTHPQDVLDEHEVISDE